VINRMNVQMVVLLITWPICGDWLSYGFL
jgi:hypothetical protein